MIVSGVRWAGPLKAGDKPARIIKRSGGKISPNRYLGASALLVRIDTADLEKLAAHDEVSFVYPASKAVIQNLPVHRCPGPLTEFGAVANYAANGSGWDGPGAGSAALTYYFVNGTPDVTDEQSEVVRALNVWSQYAEITWTPASLPNRNRSIDISWSSFDHGDPFPFDGPGNVLAHCFYPSPPNSETIAGDMHLDESETWRVGVDTDIFSVALHEAGHGLGLNHSDDPSAVMYPSYSGVVAGLQADDIAGIRSLYATSGGGGGSGDSYEPDNSPAQARQIDTGSEQSHSIVPADDLDYVRFSLANLQTS